MAFLKNVLFDTQTIKLTEMTYGIGDVLIEGDTFVQTDATISESYSTSSSVTNYPVEKGSRLSDHSSRESFRLSISGIISDSSMSYADTFDSLLGSPVADLISRFAGSNLKSKSQKAYDQLQKWMVEATPITVRCHYAKDGIKDDNGDNAPFVIESLNIPRDKTTGQSIRFELSIRQVIIVQINKAVATTVSLVKAKDKGAQVLKDNNKAKTADKNNTAQGRTVAPLLENAKAQNYWGFN